MSLSNGSPAGGDSWQVPAADLANTYDAERLRALLRDTRPADLNDLSVLQRVGGTLVRAMYRGDQKSPALGTLKRTNGKPGGDAFTPPPGLLGTAAWFGVEAGHGVGKREPQR